MKFTMQVRYHTRYEKYIPTSLVKYHYFFLKFHIVFEYLILKHME